MISIECAEHELSINYVSFQVAIVARRCQETSRQVISILLEYSYRRNYFSFRCFEFYLVFAAIINSLFRRIFCIAIIVTKGCRERLVGLGGIIFYKSTGQFIAINFSMQLGIKNMEYHFYRVAKN